MKVKTWIPLVLAVVLGLVAAKMVRDQMMRGKGEATDSNLVTTVTAARDITPGQRLTLDDLMITKVPATQVANGSFKTPTEVLDRVTLTGMVQGQHVLPNLLAPDGTAAGVQALIPPGMRALTIQVSEFSGVAGMLVPGCKVDVVSVIRDEKDKQLARTIVQNVEVRAVGRQISKNVSPPPVPTADAPQVPVPNNVTLLVTPDQAEAIQLSSVGAPPWLVLRNGKDEEAVESDGVSLADLRGAKDTKINSEAKVPTALAGTDPFAQPEGRAAATSARTRTVTIIRATKSEAVQVDLAPAPPTDWLQTSTDKSSATGE
jgi:pilus assembly protein CpaB